MPNLLPHKVHQLINSKCFIENGLKEPRSGFFVFWSGFLIVHFAKGRVIPSVFPITVFLNHMVKKNTATIPSAPNLTQMSIYSGQQSPQKHILPTKIALKFHFQRNLRSGTCLYIQPSFQKTVDLVSNALVLVKVIKNIF